ncbi:MAG: sodium:solute symporter family transporter [Opitutaceae bacterium]
MFANFTLIDGLIVLLYFGAVLGIGWFQSRKGGDSEDFITGSRQMPWLAVLGSLVATEVSAATFLGTPGAGFSQNMNYLQMGVGSFLARIFIAFAFLGAFYSVQSLTIYDFLAKRFGNRTRYTASAFFIVTRLLASSVRLMIASTGLSLILNVPFIWCLAAFTVIAIAYTGSGGIRGIIWTDVLQAFVFIGSGLILIAFIAHSIGWQNILEIGRENGRFEIFKFTPDSDGIGGWFNDSKLFYVAVLFGFISTTAAFGTDQDLTQRMLTCKDVKSARRSVILSGMVSIPVAALFLFVGIALFAFYQINADPTLPHQINDGVVTVMADKVFPWFIANELPAGLRGLLLVGVLAAAMSSLDSAMGALSSSALVDLYRPLVPKSSQNIPDIWISRGFVVLFGLILSSVAWMLEGASGFLWLSFQIVSVTYGALLGVFLLGLLTKRGSDKGNSIAMLSGAGISAIFLALIKLEILPLGWTWLIVIGTAWTFTLGYFWKR